MNGIAMAAAIDWDHGADGPKLARATISSPYDGGDMQIEAATAVANK